MSIVSTGLSAIGRLAAIGLLAAVFLFALAGVVYMSLQGDEVTVPEITGKDLSASEKELALLGLKIRKRSDRVSAEKPGTVIEQLPKPGDTVKTGQWISVVTSKGGGEADLPASLKETINDDDTEKIEEMISDKPKKPKANSNTNRKKADTARDVNTNSSNSVLADSNSNKKDPGSNNNSTDKPNKNTQTPSVTRSPAPAAPKPAVQKSPARQ